jgi:phosphatidylglycerol:prolipoprotein diacylglycerol transferase
VLMALLIIIWIAPYATWAFRTIVNRARGKETQPFRLPPFETTFTEKSVSITPWLDYAGIVLPLAQSIGRWANFVNQELYGLPTTLPWGITIDQAHRVAPYNNGVEFPFAGADVTKFHPLFLYESLWNLIAFFVLLNLYNRNRNLFRRGDFFLLYIMQYSFVRFLLEFIRVEQSLVGGINTSQVITAAAFVIALVIFVVRRNRASEPATSVAVDKA